MKYRPLNFTKVKTYSIAKRPSKVQADFMAKPHAKGATFAQFMDSLPPLLGAQDLREVARAIAAARRAGRPVVLGMGAHVIKVGLSSLIIDLMQRGVITALATNGACMVHDFELSSEGRTSEDVAHALKDGSFGMARETGKHINTAINKGVAKGMGLGQALGQYINAGRFPHKGLSLFGTAARLDIPMTVHVAMGTDIVHMHPSADGASIGEGSMRDFRLFASVVADLQDGVYINLGSAVILPEVFLKALSVARNLGHEVSRMVTVNMDFIQHYRPRENVLKRPTLGGGASYALTGHHEIMLPLLAAAVIEEMD